MRSCAGIPLCRRALTRHDPLLFALLYCPGALKDEDGSTTFSDVHLELCRIAARWAVRKTGAKQQRYSVTAPRNAGKSTWAFKLLPLWAAAHFHKKFIVAFADTADQASNHLMNFRAETESNKLLQEDFPDLCKAAKRVQMGSVWGDSRYEYRAQSGIVLKARGADSSVLGAKEGDRRPDLIVIDDFERQEASYSVAQALKRLGVLQDSILPLNARASVLVTRHDHDERIDRG